MGLLEGKVVIITGAGSGIGRASALRFAEEGAKLVIGDKSEAVHETAKMVADAGGTVTGIQMDAGVEADVAAMVATAIQSYGGLHVAFANAGIGGGMAGIFDLTPEEWTEILRVNLIGPWLMVKHAGKAMAEAGQGGSIICTASVAGIKKTTFIGQAAYPQSQPNKIDDVAEAHVAKLKKLVDATRELRGEMKVSPATRLPLFVLGDTEFMTASGPVIKALAKLSEVTVFADEAAWAAAAQAAPVAVVGDAKLCLHMEVDVAAEKLRLGKEITRLEGELVKVQAKLANVAFVSKVPPAVLAQEHKRQDDFTATLEKLNAQLLRLA